ncbi:hypothetical protein BESB_039750 [Besnoitia besnoiti]|uniref:AP2 domain transcription factor AP2XII-1 n=1 Tax=Besnoitia besnoiti TaxID=94643 RepID=A0A2A9MNN0_BESBE|nr:hypothetical protein BESB_039750 [Besnoitia besnoiti]PFH37517.1 hypothetical protein BESB_039750 [Besnoitia besnoiti]
MQWCRRQGGHELSEEYLRARPTFRDASSSRHASGQYASPPPVYALPSARSPWLAKEGGAAPAGAGASSLSSPGAGSWPLKPHAYSYADIQEAMESPVGVLRISPPQLKPPGTGDDDDDRSSATLPKGAETLFWSRGRGLYFLRETDRNKGEDLEGEAGFWVAASEEEYGGYVIHRKFSVAKFGFERAKMVAFRWYNDRHEFRRGPLGRSRNRASPEGAGADRDLPPREAPLGSSFFRWDSGRSSRVGGDVGDKAAVDESKPAGVENPRPKARLMDTSCPVPGVRYDSRDRAWLATWHDGIRQYKRCFSIKKYGFVKAKELAVRMKMSLNAQMGTPAPPGSAASQASPAGPFPSAFRAHFLPRGAPPSRHDSARGDTVAAPEWPRPRSASALPAPSTFASPSATSATQGARDDDCGGFGRDEEGERPSGRQGSLSACFTSLIRSLAGGDRGEAAAAGGTRGPFAGVDRRDEKERRGCEGGGRLSYRSVVENLLASLSEGGGGSSRGHHLLQGEDGALVRKQLIELQSQLVRQLWRGGPRGGNGARLPASPLLGSRDDELAAAALDLAERRHGERDLVAGRGGGLGERERHQGDRGGGRRKGETAPDAESGVNKNGRGFASRGGAADALLAELSSPRAAEEVESFLRSLSSQSRDSLLDSLRRGGAGEEREQRLSGWTDAWRAFLAARRSGGSSSAAAEDREAKEAAAGGGGSKRSFAGAAFGCEDRREPRGDAVSPILAPFGLDERNGAEELRAAAAQRREQRLLADGVEKETAGGEEWLPRRAKEESFWGGAAGLGSSEQKGGGDGLEAVSQSANASGGGLGSLTPSRPASTGGEEKAAGPQDDARGVRRFAGDEALDRDDDMGADAYASFTQLTKREWELLDYLDTLDFETADLDAVMPLINQVPKVRGVCFDRKGLYWISQWHSQQKKHREWFGVKRLGFRKAWALAVCVRRDAEKVEDEPIDYPRIPDYEEVLGVTYARGPSGRYWVAHFAKTLPAASPYYLGSVGRKLFPVSESSFEEARRQAARLVAQAPLPRAFFLDPDRRTTSAFESSRAGECALPTTAADRQFVSRKRLFNVFTWLNGGASWTNVRRWAHAKRMQLAEEDWPVQFPHSGKLTADACGEGERGDADARSFAGDEGVKKEHGSSARPDWLFAPGAIGAENFSPSSVSVPSGAVASASSVTPAGSQKPLPLCHPEETSQSTNREATEEGETVSPAESVRGDARGLDEDLGAGGAAGSREGTAKAREKDEGGGALRSDREGGGVGAAGAAPLAGARAGCEEEGAEEPLSPIDIDSIVADAYESFSDEDAAEADGLGGAGKQSRRIRLPKIGGVYYKRDGNYKAWAASWHIQGKRTRRYFTVKKHGFMNAYLKAVRARREAERHEGISVKHRHHALVAGGGGQAAGTASGGAAALPGDDDARGGLLRSASLASSAAGFPHAIARLLRDRVQANFWGPTPKGDEDAADRPGGHGEKAWLGAAANGSPRGAEAYAPSAVRRDGGAAADAGVPHAEKSGRGGDSAREAGLPPRRAGEEEAPGDGEEDGRGAAALRVGGNLRGEALLHSTAQVSVHLTPLERVAKAIDIDLEELTDRICRAARGRDDGEEDALFRSSSRGVDEDEEDERASHDDALARRLDEKAASAHSGVSKSLEFAMARETLDVLLSDLYSVVSKLSGAGRWVALASPASASSGEPLTGSWLGEAGEQSSKRGRAEADLGGVRERESESVSLCGEEVGPSSTSELHVILQLVVIKHYLSSVRVATKGEQIAPLLALFEPCIKQGLLPHQCCVSRLRWLVCQLCRASIPWLDERNVLTDALLYRRLEELAAEDGDSGGDDADLDDGAPAPAGLITFSSGFGDGAGGSRGGGEARVGDALARKSRQAALALSFRTDSEEEASPGEADDTCLAALIEGGLTKDAEPNGGETRRDAEKSDGVCSGLQCETGEPQGGLSENDGSEVLRCARQKLGSAAPAEDASGSTQSAKPAGRGRVQCEEGKEQACCLLLSASTAPSSAETAGKLKNATPRERSTEPKGRADDALAPGSPRQLAEEGAEESTHGAEARDRASVAFADEVKAAGPVRAPGDSAEGEMKEGAAQRCVAAALSPASSSRGANGDICAAAGLGACEPGEEAGVSSSLLASRCGTPAPVSAATPSGRSTVSSDVPA